jgi:hypothetical protein
MLLNDTILGGAKVTFLKATAKINNLMYLNKTQEVV